MLTTCPIYISIHAAHVCMKVPSEVDGKRSLRRPHHVVVTFKFESNVQLWSNAEMHTTSAIYSCLHVCMKSASEVEVKRSLGRPHKAVATLKLESNVQLWSKTNAHYVYYLHIYTRSTRLYEGSI